MNDKKLKETNPFHFYVNKKMLNYNVKADVGKAIKQKTLSRRWNNNLINFCTFVG